MFLVSWIVNTFARQATDADHANGTTGDSFEPITHSQSSLETGECPRRCAKDYHSLTTVAQRLRCCRINEANFMDGKSLTSKQTVLANWPILCKLWPHAYGHVRSGKLDRDGCDQPKLRIVKTFAEDQPFINDVNKEDLTTTIATKKVVHLLAIIAQILKLRRKLSDDAQAQNHATTRTSSPLSPLSQSTMKNPYETDLEIGASVTFLQESHPGQMDPMQTTPGPYEMEDIYVGGGHGQGPIGYVSTDITSQASQPSTIMSRLKPVHSWHVKDKLK
jgi:hypothetical protein